MKYPVWCMSLEISTEQFVLTIFIWNIHILVPKCLFYTHLTGYVSLPN